MIRASLNLLRALTLIAASVALAAQAIAICSNAWLYSIELMPNPRYNGTGDREYLSKHTVSGLWRLCYNDREKGNQNGNKTVPSCITPEISFVVRCSGFQQALLS
ncbi:hypothetical protein NPIL_223081, partial [Nephila pilipes]